MKLNNEKARSQKLLDEINQLKSTVSELATAPSSIAAPSSSTAAAEEIARLRLEKETAVLAERKAIAMECAKEIDSIAAKLKSEKKAACEKAVGAMICRLRQESGLSLKNRDITGTTVAVRSFS